MDDSFTTALNHIKQQVLTEILTHKNKIPIKIQQQLLAFYGEDIVDIRTVCHWLRILRDSGGNMDINDQPCSRRPVTATHCVNRQNVYELIKKKSKNSSDSHSRKFEQ
jgi:hypothetical protein